MPPMPMEEMPPEMGGFSPLPSMPPMDAGGAAPPPGGDMGMMPPPEAMGMPPEGMEQPEQPPPPPPPPPPKSAMPALPPKPPTIVWGMDGQPMVVKVLRDRPRVRPCQPEHAIIDLTAPWEDVIQEGEFFIMQIPMRISQIRRMQKKGRQNMGGGQWLPVTDSELKSAVEAYSATQVKQARGRGIDPFSAGNQPSFSDYDVVWVHENFIQLDGTDMHFYSLGTTAILSVPGPTEEHYPAHKGERPYVMGLGEIEAFSPVPMSMVESIQPIQNEVNDIRNLSIDTLKQGIAPIGVYRRGADIDLRALKERGPDANIGVSNMEDLRFEKPPGPDPTSFAMHDRLTIEMDESAGSFSTSSVNNNRAVGETVGGMQLVSNAANSVQEYDLRVYVETYVERVLRQLIMLEQHYETDETVLALVGQKADVYQRFGVDEPIDDLLQRQVTLKVNAGVGSTDPFMKLQKFSSAIQMAGMVAPFVEGQVTVNAEEVYGEIFASAGYQAERFFQFTSPEEAMQAASQQPDPVQMKAEADMQMAQANVQKAEADARKTEIEGQKLQIEGARLELEYANLRDQSEERRARFGLEIDQFDRANMNADRDFEEQQRLADRDGMQNDRDFEEGRRVSDRDFAENRFASERDFAEGQRVSDRDFAEGRRTSDRDFEAEQESGGRDFGLRANAQNKQLTDEATGEAEELLTPQEAREPLPVEMAMQQGIEALMQALAQLAQSQEMQTQALAQIASGQANIDASLSTIAAAVAQRPTVERVRKGMGMKPKPDEEEPDNGS